GPDALQIRFAPRRLDRRRRPGRRGLALACDRGQGHERERDRDTHERKKSVFHLHLTTFRASTHCGLPLLASVALSLASVSRRRDINPQKSSLAQNSVDVSLTVKHFLPRKQRGEHHTIFIPYASDAF